MRIEKHLFWALILTLGFFLSGCSVGSVITPPSSTSGVTPELPNKSLTPTDDQEAVTGPVIVGAPLPVVSEPSPNSPSESEVTSATPPPSSKASPDTTSPSENPLMDSSLRTQSSYPLANPQPYAPPEDDPFQGETLPTVSMENPITEFDEMPPAAATKVVNVSPMIQVSEATENESNPNAMDPSPSSDLSNPELPTSSAPQTVLDAVTGVSPDSLPGDINAPSTGMIADENPEDEYDQPSREPASVPSEDSLVPARPQDPFDSDSTAENNDNSDEQEVVVKGLCMGKKRAAIVWSDRRLEKPIKKSKAVKCTNGAFRLTFKEKKTNLKYIEVQTAFYD